MKENNDLTQNVLNDLQYRLNSIMGYLKQLDPIKFKSQTSSSKELGLERSNLSAALNGDSRYLNKDSMVIDKIFKKFPEINREWFENGKGDMLLNGVVKSDKSSVVFNNLKLEEKLTFLYEQNIELKEDNENLKDMIDSLSLTLEISLAPILRHFNLSKDKEVNKQENKSSIN